MGISCSGMHWRWCGIGSNGRKLELDNDLVRCRMITESKRPQKKRMNLRLGRRSGGGDSQTVARWKKSCCFRLRQIIECTFTGAMTGNACMVETLLPSSQSAYCPVVRSDFKPSPIEAFLSKQSYEISRMQIKLHENKAIGDSNLLPVSWKMVKP